MIKNFYLQEKRSPTEANLARHLLMRGFKKTRFLCRAHFDERYLDFHENAAKTLEYKHLLSTLVKKYCPHLMPLSYHANELSWFSILKKIREDFYEKASEKGGSPVFIVKPALLNNGKHISICENLIKLHDFFEDIRRPLGDYVIQQYITHPHLLEGQRKYTVRLLLVLTSENGAFLYRDGYANVSRQPYIASHFDDFSIHLTNEHLRETPNVIQIPLSAFPFYATHYSSMKAQLSSLVHALKDVFPEAFLSKKHPNFGIFGMDFLVDASGRSWLLEGNHGPCFPINLTHPLSQCLYEPFWSSLVSDCILPMIDKKPPSKAFFKHFDAL